jgi:hypothetical protein
MAVLPPRAGFVEDAGSKVKGPTTSAKATVVEMSKMSPLVRREE